jgi:hypothetical protein
MIDEFAKDCLHHDLRWIREALVWKLDGAVGTDAQSTALAEYDAAYWENHRAKIEQAARAADPANA